MVVTFPLLPPEERYKELVGLVGNGLGALPPYCQVEAWARTPQSLGEGRDEGSSGEGNADIRRQ